jgi:hypothetical protein
VKEQVIGMGIRQRLSTFTSKSNVTLALCTVIAGFVMMWTSTLGGISVRANRTVALARAVEIDPLVPSARFNGQLVVAAANLQPVEPAVPFDDPYLKPQQALVLRRHVEMFQWTERIDVESGAKPEYQMKWVEGEVDFFDFKEPTGHENPVLKIKSQEQRVSNVTFGGFDGSKVLQVIGNIPRFELKPEILKDPTLTIEENKIVIQRDPSVQGSALGDMRIWYECLPVGAYTVLARQVDEQTLLGSTPASDVLIRAGVFSAVELIEATSAEAQTAYSGFRYLGALLFCGGLLSLLLPYAARIDFRPKLELRGVPAVLFLSAGVTLVVLVLLIVLSWFE